MSGSQRIEIQKWLSKKAGKDGRKLRMIRLCQALNNPGFKGTCETFQFEGPINVPETASEILDTANVEAKALGGTQKFMLFPYFDDDVEPDGRLPFYIQNDELSGTDSEPLNQPSAAGIVAHRLRHLAQSHALAATQLGEIMRQQSRIIDTQRQEISDANADRIAMLRAASELYAEQGRREHEKQALESAEALKREMIARLMPLLPVVLSKLTGVPMQNGQPAGQAEAQSAVLDEFIRSLKPEQMQGLQGMLSFEQAALVMQLIEGNKQVALAQQAAVEAQNATALSQVAPDPMAMTVDP
jgi:hypothetical protein